MKKKVERNYSNENSRQKELNRIYKVKVNLDIANKFDEKLKKEKIYKNYSEFAREAIEKYLEKNKKLLKKY